MSNEATTPAPRWHAWLVLGVALLMTLPSLRVGAILDDWMHRALVRGELLDRAWWDLFNFADGNPEHLKPFLETGPYPWYTLPDLRLRFFRPLSSALIQLDGRLFGDAVWAAHLHTTLWYLALVAVVRALYRRLVPHVALAAALLFAVDDAHTIPVMWLANRNSLVAVTFAWLGLWAHLQWRERGWKPGLPLSFFAFITALSGGETAVAAMAYVVAYELVGRPKGEARSARLRGVAPATVAVLLFAVLYKTMGMGSRGSATYLDPSSEPLAWLSNAPTRFLAMVGGQTTVVPPDLWLSLPVARPLLVGLGVVALASWWLAWRRWAPTDADERRTLQWLWLGAVLALIPPLSTFPSARLWLAPSLGAGAVVATFLRGAWREGGWRRAVGAGWIVASFVVQPLVSWLSVNQAFTEVGVRTTRAVLDLDVKPGEKLIVVASSDFTPAVYGVPVLSEHHLPPPATWHVWSMAPYAHHWTRLSEDEVELRADGPMVRSVFEENFRATDTRPFSVGDEVAVQGMTYRVTEVQDGAPTALRIRFSVPMTGYRYVTWNGETLVTVAPPALGQTVELPRGTTIFERILLGKP